MSKRRQRRMNKHMRKMSKEMRELIDDAQDEISEQLKDTAEDLRERVGKFDGKMRNRAEQVAVNPTPVFQLVAVHVEHAATDAATRSVHVVFNGATIRQCDGEEDSVEMGQPSPGLVLARRGARCEAASNGTALRKARTPSGLRR